MKQVRNSTNYDLEERTLRFAKRVREFCRGFRKTLTNMDDLRQLIRSSGSVGANYIEANESLSKKDFVLRVKICRKEAKESGYWLELINTEGDKCAEQERLCLLNEALQLRKIFGAILERCG